MVFHEDIFPFATEELHPFPDFFSSQNDFTTDHREVPAVVNEIPAVVNDSPVVDASLTTDQISVPEGNKRAAKQPAYL